MSPPLDHAMYPHIIEDIIHYVSSSRPTLFALRCTCGICNIPTVTDRYLVKHLVFSQEGDSIDTCVEVRPHGCGGGFMPWAKFTFDAPEKDTDTANDGGGSQGDPNPDTEDGGSEGDTNPDTEDDGSSTVPAGGIIPVSDDSDPGISLGDTAVGAGADWDTQMNATEGNLSDADSDTDPDWTCSISSESDSEDDDDEEQGRVADWYDLGLSALQRPAVLDIVGNVQPALDDRFRSHIVVDDVETVRLVPDPHFNVLAHVPLFVDDEGRPLFKHSGQSLCQLNPDVATPSQSSLVALGPIKNVIQFAHWYERGGPCQWSTPNSFVDLLKPHDGTQRIVYNIIFRNDEKRFGGIINAPNFQQAHGLKDIVFLFTIEGEKRSAFTHYSVRMLFSMIASVAKLLSRPDPPYITFVGLNELPPQWVYGDNNGEGCVMFYVLLEIDRVLRDSHPLWDEARHRRAHTRVEILTRQEYRQQVGEKRYRLEVDL